MKISLLLMAAMTILVLNCLMAPGADAASTRLDRARARMRALRGKQSSRNTKSVSYINIRRGNNARKPAARRTSRLSKSTGRSGRKISRSGRRVSSSRRRNGRRTNAVNRRTNKVSVRGRARSNVRRRNNRRRNNGVRRSRFGRRRGRQEIAEKEEEDITSDPSDENKIDIEDMTIDELAAMVEEGPSDPIEAEAMAEAVEEAMKDPVKRQAVDNNPQDGIPDWCNWRKPMGAWLNFRNMRSWCSTKGFNRFGPYGGIAKASDGEEDGDEVVDSDDENDTEDENDSGDDTSGDEDTTDDEANE